MLIGLSFLRSRPVVEVALASAVGVAAVAGLARENRARIWARLTDWYNRQNLRHQRPIKTA